MAVISEDFRAIRMFRDECDYGMGYVNLPCIGPRSICPSAASRKRQRPPFGRRLIETVTHKRRGP